MRTSSEDFRAYLVPGETVGFACAGTLIDDGEPLEGAFGLTDRRVLFVSESGTFVDFKHEYVSSTRSRSRTRLTARGLAARATAAAGVGLAAVGFLAVAASTRSPLAVAVSALLVASLGGLTYVHRHDLDVDRSAFADAVGRLVADRALDVRAFEAVLYRRDPARYTYGSNHGHLLVGLGVVGVVSLTSLYALAGSLPVVGAALGAVGGLFLADLGYRRMRTLDRVGGSRTHRRETSVHLVDGRVLRLRVDLSEPIDRELSRLAGAAPGRSAEPLPGEA